MKRIKIFCVFIFLFFSACGSRNASDVTEENFIPVGNFEIEIESEIVNEEIQTPAQIPTPIQQATPRTETRFETWQEAYAEFLRETRGYPVPQSEFYAQLEEYYQASADSFELSFALYDFDGDGVPELVILHRGSSMVCGSGLNIFTFADGAVNFLGYIPTWRARYGFSVSDDPDFPGVFFGYVHMGFFNSYYGEIVDGQTVIMEVFTVRYVSDDEEEIWHLDEPLYDAMQDAVAFPESYSIVDVNIEDILFGGREGEDWAQGFTGDNPYVRRRIAGHTLRAYSRATHGDIAVELFSTYHRHNLVGGRFNDVSDYETWVFVSYFEDGEYRLADYFEVPVGGWSPRIGTEIFFADVDFDGEKDILISAQSTFGWFTVPTAYAFLNRGGRYVFSNFNRIPEPHLDFENQRVMGIVPTECTSLMFSIYVIENDEFILTDSYMQVFCTGEGEWDFCRGIEEFVYVVYTRDGVDVNEIYREEEDAALILELFYGEGSIWNADWQPLFSLH
jgi:hypothetical protein